MRSHTFPVCSLLCGTALLLAFATAGQTQQPATKIAVIDMEKVFQSYFKTKIADANLKKQAETYRNYLTSLNDSKVKLREEFKELRDDSQNIAITETERENKRIAAQDKYRQLQAKEQEIEQYNQEKKKKLLEEYDKIRESLLEEIAKVVRTRGVREGYTLVIDKSGKTMNSIPAVVFHEEGIDLTEVVMKELNLGHEEKVEKTEKTEKVEKTEKAEKVAEKTASADIATDTDKAKK